MTSSISISPDDVRRIFSADAVYCVEDSEVGGQVEAMQKRGMQLESSDGIDFLKHIVLKDERIIQFLHTLFSRFGLGIYEVFRWSKDQTIYGFMTGKLPRSAVVVQLWAPKSKMVYYRGSHLLPLEGFPLSIGLLDIPFAPLKRCTKIEVDMANGGLAIFDARLAFQITAGYAIHCVFATREEVQTWRKKLYPNDLDLQRKAAEMESPVFSLNFSFTGQTDVHEDEV